MIALAVATLVGACGERTVVATGGDARNGQLLLRQFGCGSCHRIPGVVAAVGTAGPPLDALARRSYLAGLVPNTPDQLVRWIREPQAIDPRTAMPDLSVSEAHARDMAAYLYELR